MMAEPGVVRGVGHFPSAHWTAEEIQVVAPPCMTWVESRETPTARGEAGTDEAEAQTTSSRPLQRSSASDEDTNAC